MKRKIKTNKMTNLSLIIFIIFNLFNFCHTKNQSTIINQENCNLNVEYLGNELLGKKLASVDSILGCFEVRDTTFEDEVTWKGKAIYKSYKRLLITEGTWQNNEIIHRIVIESPLISTLSGVKVGDKLGDVNSFMSSNIPSMPDGYFGLRDISNNNITYFFNVDNYQNLAEGRGITFSQLPKEITITYIVLQNND